MIFSNKFRHHNLRWRGETQIRNLIIICVFLFYVFIHIYDRIRFGSCFRIRVKFDLFLSFLLCFFQSWPLSIVRVISYSRMCVCWRKYYESDVASLPLVAWPRFREMRPSCCTQPRLQHLQRKRPIRRVNRDPCLFRTNLYHERTIRHIHYSYFVRIRRCACPLYI